MHSLFGPRVAMLLAALLVVSATTFGVSYGQGVEEPGVAVLRAQQATGTPPTAAPQAAAVPAQDTQSTYLPLMIADYKPVQFSVAVDENGVPINPTNTFAYGIQDLSISSLVGGTPGVTYRLVVVAPDGTELPETYPGRSSQFYAIVQICLTTGVNCETGSKSPLPRGMYKGRLFVNGELVREDSAVIQ